MKNQELAVKVYQALLIFMLSAAGAYAFSKYPFGISCIEELCVLVNNYAVGCGLPDLYPHLINASTVLKILAVLLFFWGLFSVLIKGRSGGPFLFLIGLLILPSTVSFSFIKWPRLLDFLLHAPGDIWETELSYTECYLFMMLLVTGQLSFRFISRFRDDKQKLEARGGDPEDVDEVFKGACSLMFLSMSGVFLVFTVLLTPSIYINELIYFLVENIPLGLIILGVSFSLTITVSAYFLVKKVLRVELTTPVGYRRVKEAIASKKRQLFFEKEARRPLENKIFLLIKDAGRIRREEIVKTLKKEGAKEEEVEEALEMMARHDIIATENGEIYIRSFTFLESGNDLENG